LTVIAFVLAIAALYFGRKVFIPLALAVVFSFLLTPDQVASTTGTYTKPAVASSLPIPPTEP